MTDISICYKDIYELYIRKLNIYLSNRNWIKFNFDDNNGYIKLIINPLKNTICLNLVNDIKSINLIISKSTYNNHINMKITIVKQDNGYQFIFEKNMINIITIKIITSIETSFWIDMDGFDRNSQPIPFKKQQLEKLQIDKRDEILKEIQDSIILIDNDIDKDKGIYIDKDKDKGIYIDKDKDKDKDKDIDIDKDKDKDKDKDIDKDRDIDRDIGNYIAKPYLPPLIRSIKLKKFISFGITCLNRLSQIKITLSKNLFDNLDLISVSEFIVVDFGTPGLSDYITSNFIKELECGYLKYYQDYSLPYWHASFAKNIVHNKCNGTFITNLDCDNFIGYRGGNHILNFFEKLGNDVLLHQWSGTNKDGTYGRITCKKKNFLFLGGYDESFLPMGYQDHDFIMRYVMYFKKRNYVSYDSFTNKIPFLKYCQAIKNDKVASLENTQYNGKLKWNEMNKINKMKSKNNIRKGIFMVNQ